MSPRGLKILTFVLFVVLVAGLSILIFVDKPENTQESDTTDEQTVEQTTLEPFTSHETIGMSVIGRPIEAYAFGNGDVHVLFVGGIHGGYEWNSVLLAYTLIDYLQANPLEVPKNVTISVIPSANPDGLFEVLHKEGRFTLADVPDQTNMNGAGRFNSNKVDLNRNFDCKWQPQSSWRNTPVSAGTKAFSEPESRAIRDFVAQTKPHGVIFFHSQSNAVYASECNEGVLPETRTLMNTYASAAGYKAVDSFDAYPITGDAEGWLASIHIPAITVELAAHDSIEWDRNLAGIKALFTYLGK